MSLYSVDYLTSSYVLLSLNKINKIVFFSERQDETNHGDIVLWTLIYKHSYFYVKNIKVLTPSGPTSLSIDRSRKNDAVGYHFPPLHFLIRTFFLSFPFSDLLRL